MASKLSLAWMAAIVVCSLLLSANGCKKESSVAQKDKLSDIRVEPQIQGDEPPTVLFDMKLSDSARPGTSPIYDCTYTAGGKMARFRFQYEQNGVVSGDFPVAKVKGKFLSVAGSDNSALLGDLKKALDAQRIPQKSPRIAELAFDAVILGEKQSRDSRGGYASEPPGDWIAMKLFFPKGRGDKGEVFLNINPIAGKAEISIKDSDYGDYLLTEFAKVL